MAAEHTCGGPQAAAGQVADALHVAWYGFDALTAAPDCGWPTWEAAKGGIEQATVDVLAAAKDELVAPATHSGVSSSAVAWRDCIGNFRHRVAQVVKCQ